MAETANIGRMAEKLSDDLFDEFFWRKVGPTNINWACQKSALHGVKTHPSDVVFYYEEPYQKIRTYIQCDLKSYAAGTIKSAAVKSAAESLATQVSCAEISSEWQGHFVDPEVTAQVVGMLFVYNHDGDYDQKFGNLVSAVRPEKLDLAPGRRVFILGPDIIHWLDNVRYDIRQLRGAGRIPSKGSCGFYHPHLVQKSNIQGDIASAATLEMLTSQVISMVYRPEKRRDRTGVLIYYRGKPSLSNFSYLIDYIRHFQLLREDVEVQIRLLASENDVRAKFQLAANTAIEQEGGGTDSEFAQWIRAIRCDAISQVLTQFSEIEIGMDYVR